MMNQSLSPSPEKSPSPDNGQPIGQFMQWLEQARQGVGGAALAGAAAVQQVAVATHPITIEAIPVGDAQQVRELSPSILGCYRVTDGHCELSGCTLEPLPLLRLTSRLDEGQVRHCWFGGDGKPLADELIQRLGLSQLTPCDDRLRAHDAPMVQRWIDIAAQSWSQNGAAAQVDSPDGMTTQAEWLAATIAWCRWAAGTVAFRFANGAVGRCRFEGWAVDFVSGQQQPSKFHCAASGAESFDVLALVDGTVTVPQAVAKCESTGTVTLKSNLKTCEVSGQQVLSELLSQCPISGLWALPDRLEACLWCGRPVAPGRIQQQLCSDCRGGQAIDGDDPLLTELLTDLIARQCELADYGRWRGWRDAQTAVFVGRRWRGQIAVVYDRDKGQLRRLARRGRWSRRWHVEDA